MKINNEMENISYLEISLEKLVLFWYYFGIVVIAYFENHSKYAKK